MKFSVVPSFETVGTASGETARSFCAIWKTGTENCTTLFPEEKNKPEPRGSSLVAGSTVRATVVVPLLPLWGVMCTQLSWALTVQLVLEVTEKYLVSPSRVVMTACSAVSRVVKDRGFSVLSSALQPQYPMQSRETHSMFRILFMV